MCSWPQREPTSEPDRQSFTLTFTRVASALPPHPGTVCVAFQRRVPCCSPSPTRLLRSKPAPLRQWHVSHVGPRHANVCIKTGSNLNSTRNGNFTPDATVPLPLTSVVLALNLLFAVHVCSDGGPYHAVRARHSCSSDPFYLLWMYFDNNNRVPWASVAPSEGCQSVGVGWLTSPSCVPSGARRVRGARRSSRCPCLEAGGLGPHSDFQGLSLPTAPPRPRWWPTAGGSAATAAQQTFVASVYAQMKRVVLHHRLEPAGSYRALGATRGGYCEVAPGTGLIRDSCRAGHFWHVWSSTAWREVHRKGRRDSPRLLPECRLRRRLALTCSNLPPGPFPCSALPWHVHCPSSAASGDGLSPVPRSPPTRQDGLWSPDFRFCGGRFAFFLPRPSLFNPPSCHWVSFCTVTVFAPEVSSLPKS